MKGPIRVVLDTNIFLSSLITDGACRKVIEALHVRIYVLYVNNDLLKEIETVAKREYFRQYFVIEVAERLLSFIKAKAVLVDTKISIPPGLQSSDIGDNHIVECVLVSNAEILVTGNKKHFQKLSSKVKAFTAQEFLDYISQQT